MGGLEPQKRQERGEKKGDVGLLGRKGALEANHFVKEKRTAKERFIGAGTKKWVGEG